ncbi:MAG: hypothetical protein II230_01880, partial [Clostridia bacterium]|nr:hypothetical protein [Clostridia bacterium]
KNVELYYIDLVAGPGVGIANVEGEVANRAYYNLSGVVGYKPQSGDKLIIIEDVITAGTAVRETMPILYGCGDVTVNDMFISVNRCEVGKIPGKTAIMEVKEEFGINVHAIVTVEDIHEYLKQSGEYADILPAMEKYMADYCVL